MTNADTDLIAALIAIIGQERYDAALNHPRGPWDGEVEGPEPDLYVSPSDARHMQRGYDSQLTQTWGPQV